MNPSAPLNFYEGLKFPGFVLAPSLAIIHRGAGNRRGRPQILSDMLHLMWIDRDGSLND
jgi:hypothetical protein